MTNEQATLSVEDRFEIFELLARYAWSFDDRDGDAYAAVFTEDGTMQGPQLTISGQEDLRAWAANYPPVTYQHTVANVVIEGSGTEASSKCYVIATQADDDSIRPVLMGKYHDTLRKTGAGWRIAHRQLIIQKWGGHHS